MELVQELLLTVLMAALLSFVLAKLVSVVAAKDVSGETLYSESPAMEEVKFEDRLRAPDVERDDRVQFVEEVTVGKVDHFEPGEFIMLEAEAEAEKDAVRGEEIGLESCDQLPEATERRPGAGSELKVNVSEDGKNERSDEPMKSPEEYSSREVAFEKNLDISEEIQTEPSGAPMESTELPQKSASDVELNDKREDAEPEKETDQSSTEEATSDQSSTEEVTDDQALAEMETDQSSTEEVKREDAEPVKETDQSSTEEVTADQALAEMETDQSSTEEVKREDAEPEKAAHAPQSQAVAEVHEEMAISEHIDDDDWEGIERSELEKDFAVAADYCGSESVSDDLKMQLYGLHKVATEGPCYEPQPMALKVTARAKWNAWQRLGSMNPDIAMEQYITILSENLPRWKERKSLGSTEADTPTPVSGLNTKSIHQPNTTEDRTGASNASLVHNEAVMKDESLVVKVEE